MNNYSPINWITLKQVDKFLKTYNLPRLNYESIENLKRPKVSKEIDSVMKNLPTKKRSGTDCFTGAFYQIFREELTPILLMLPKIKRRENTQTHSMRPPST